MDCKGRCKDTSWSPKCVEIILTRNSEATVGREWIKYKRQPAEYKNIFANFISDKVIVWKRYKELLQLNHKMTNNPTTKWWTTWFKNGQRITMGISPKTTHKQMANEHMKRCSPSLTTGDSDICHGSISSTSAGEISIEWFEFCHSVSVSFWPQELQALILELRIRFNEANHK